MGCFSWMCSKCNKQVHSDKYGSCIGQEVYLGRLVNGVVVEWMNGRYDAYGKVHKENNSKHMILKDGKFIKAIDKEDKHEWQSAEWGTMVNEMCSRNLNEGIIAIHDKCWTGEWPDIKSKDDPNQGWE